MPSLSISGISKRFADHTALHDLSLDVADGEFFTLLGPSGCGKSTTLWSIAGLHNPDSGAIRFGDTTVFDHGRVNVAPERRNCGVVFQSYAVWPHMTVAENVGYPLKLRKQRRAERGDRVQEVLDLVELGGLGGRYPHELSGGQQQRVALARALAHPPDVLLLDEPFSNLDAKLRERAREWLRALQQRIDVTTVFVTHDQDEALSMSDRIVVMNEGRVRQIGTPNEIYEEPADMFVADFVGTANVLPARVVEADGTVATVLIDGLGVPVRVRSTSSRLGEVSLSIRPEKVRIHPPGRPGPASANELSAKVVSRSYLGDHYRYVVAVGDAVLTVQTTDRIETEELSVELPVEQIRLFHPAADTPSTEENPDEPTH